jgi:hypothetical protein
LLIVESSIRLEEIANAKRENVDVLVIGHETYSKIKELIQNMYPDRTWLSINILVHGNYSDVEQTITLFDTKMSVNPRIMFNDANVMNCKEFLIDLCDYTESIYIYTCSIGRSDGVKELCIDIANTNNLTNGIFLSTDTTGSGTWNWDVEWSTKYAYMSDEQVNEKKHYINLFTDTNKLGFTLAVNNDLLPADPSDILTVCFPVRHILASSNIDGTSSNYMGFPFADDDADVNWNTCLTNNAKTWTFNFSNSNFNNNRIGYVALDSRYQPIILSSMDNYQIPVTGNIKYWPDDVYITSVNSDIGNVQYTEYINMNPVANIRYWAPCMLTVQWYQDKSKMWPANNSSSVKIEFNYSGGNAANTVFNYNGRSGTPIIGYKRTASTMGGISKRNVTDATNFYQNYFTKKATPETKGAAIIRNNSTIWPSGQTWTTIANSTGTTAVSQTTKPLYVTMLKGILCDTTLTNRPTKESELNMYDNNYYESLGFEKTDETTEYGTYGGTTTSYTYESTNSLVALDANNNVIFVGSSVSNDCMYMRPIATVCAVSKWVNAKISLRVRMTYVKDLLSIASTAVDLLANSSKFNTSTGTTLKVAIKSNSTYIEYPKSATEIRRLYFPPTAAGCILMGTNSEVYRSTGNTDKLSQYLAN